MALHNVHGAEAEAAVARYIENEGYKILARNWRRASAEIDIVARKGGTIYFIEVKYRQRTNQGSGLEYITPKKLRHMQRAAELWVQENNWQGEYCLRAAEVEGDAFSVASIVDIV